MSATAEPHPKTLEAALYYAERGWRVIPLHSPTPDGGCTCNNPKCDSQGKHPRIKEWPKNATTKPDVIKGWFRKWPGCNIGIATGRESGLIVLDVDPDHGGDESFLSLIADNGVLPPTVESLTGGGGRHLLFLHPGVEIRNIQDNPDLLGPGLDIRADGGQIVAPPSLHKSGQRYVWEESCRPSQNDLAPMPKWLVKILVKPDAPDKKKPAFSHPLPGALAEGQRNNELTRLGGSMRRRGMEGEEISVALRTVNERRCNPPLDDTELRSIAFGMERYEPAMPGDNGKNPKIDKPEGEEKKWAKSWEYVSILKDAGYTFRLCELDDTLYVNQERMTDSLEAEIKSQLRDRGYHKVNVAADAYLAYARANSFNPIKEYLQELSWDDGDHISTLSKYICDRFDLSSLILRKWMIGAVARVMTGGRQNRVMVLEGPQGCGKSFFARWLGSPIGEHFSEAMPNPDDKDSRLALATTWIWEIKELGSVTRRADIDSLKAWLTLETIHERLPYGRYPIHKPAICNFIATVNDAGGFFNDPTGNRRYMTLAIYEMKWSYATEIDVNQLWAQAYSLFEAGEDWNLTADEEVAVQVVNNEYEFIPPAYDWLERYTQPATGSFTPTDEFLRSMKSDGLSGSDTHLSRQLAGWMKRSGYENGRAYIDIERQDKKGKHEKVSKRVRGFFGVELRRKVVSWDR